MVLYAQKAHQRSPSFLKSKALVCGVNEMTPEL